MIIAASLPRPLRMIRRGFLRTLFAISAILIAPSAAAKDSCPARNAKHSVSSRSRRTAKLPCPIPTLRSSATEPGMQNACKPIPIASAASAAFLQPFLIAIAEPTTYAHFAFSKQIRWVSSQVIYGSKPYFSQISLASSMDLIPLAFRAARICFSRRSCDSN